MSIALLWGATQAARIDAATVEVANETPRTILLAAASQDREVYVTWSPLPDAEYRLGWKTETGTEWRVVDLGPATSHAVTGLSNGVRHQFRIEAHQGGAMTAVSSVISATPRPRPDCAALDYYPWIVRVSFFCTKAALDEYMVERAINPLTLRCRQRPVTVWNEDAPNCLYTTMDGEQLLLLRSADVVFAGASQYADPAAVRQHARRAIWGENNPFDSPPPPPTWRQLAQPVTGFVTRHAQAYSFEILHPGSVTSRITWFTPRDPVGARYGIYHEGHGGAAVAIGAVTIDWLLDRGWHVIAVDMPLLGTNAADAAPGLQSHWEFDSVDDGIASPLGHYLLPLKSIVDAIVAESGGVDASVLLIGRSGGGWAIYTYAAIDPRIDIAVSVAGGRPISERLDAPWGAAELGDYEQVAPHLYDVVGHEHLMAAAGSKGSFHLFNRWDSCCFRVQRDSAFAQYLSAASGSLRKTITVFVDEENTDHSIGPRGYVELEAFLGRILNRAVPNAPTGMRIIRTRAPNSP